MNPADLKRICPHASASMLAANASVESEPVEPLTRGKRRKQMNKTEALFARILEAKVTRGEIMRFEFEAMSFRWGGTEGDAPMLYTPDFVSFYNGQVTLYEVKGAHIYSRDIVRFKGCRAHYQEFDWQMWQYVKREWHRCY